MPIEPGPRSRMLIPVLVAVFGVALGVVGIVLLRPYAQAPSPQRAAAARHDGQAPPRPLSNAAIRARIEPSVVDVTAMLTYDGETASGTGFLVDPAADLVLTNNHVVKDATSVAVTVPATGRSYAARIVGVDLAADIAVLAIRPVTGLRRRPARRLGTRGCGLACHLVR